MRTRLAWTTALVAGHLGLVALGAMGIALPTALGPARLALGLYGTLSGADTRFKLFAPGVASQLRATFTMVDDAGHTWTDTLEEGSNREVQLRIDSIVTTFYDAEFRPDLRRSFTASWAATMFGRHPDAKRVIARVDVYDLPTMDQYRRGLRPRWRNVYSAIFTRGEGKS